MKPKPTDAEPRISRTLMLAIRAVEKLKRSPVRLAFPRLSSNPSEFSTTSLDKAARIHSFSIHAFPVKRIEFTDDDETLFVFPEHEPLYWWEEWKFRKGLVVFAKDLADRAVRDKERQRRIMRKLQRMAQEVRFERDQAKLFSSPTE